jgi:hypothetical protein
VTGEPISICETCHERVDPASPDVVYAVILERLDAFDNALYVEGMGAFFHEWHYPEGSNKYRRKPKP